MDINPNRGASKEILAQYKHASYERFRVQFATAVEQKLDDFEWNWDDLAKQLTPPYNVKSVYNGDYIKQLVKTGRLTVEDMNDIAHVFSCEPYVILRPRLPYVNN